MGVAGMGFCEVTQLFQVCQMHPQETYPQPQQSHMKQTVVEDNE